MQQTTNSILMIRPINFRMNEQTAVNNYFQESVALQNAEINRKAQEEFDSYVFKLKSFGVEVLVISDTETFDTPDAIFPNNWISFHTDGTVGLYPMFAENRRLERRDDILAKIEEKGFLIEQVVDYTAAEFEDFFLEGTGSLILDRVNKKLYASLSDRTDKSIILEFSKKMNYKPIMFSSFQTIDNKRLEIYHTNVMMSIGDKFAAIGLNSIDDISCLLYTSPSPRDS